MSATNPGNWPDQGREEKMSEIMTTPELFGQMVSSPPVPVGPLYTAAERMEAYKAGVIAGKALAAVDLAAAEERGRREGYAKGTKQALDMVRGGIYLRCDKIGIGEAGFIRLADVVKVLDGLDAKEAGDETNK